MLLLLLVLALALLMLKQRQRQRTKKVRATCSRKDPPPSSIPISAWNGTTVVALKLMAWGGAQHGKSAAERAQHGGSKGRTAGRQRNWVGMACSGKARGCNMFLYSNIYCMRLATYLLVHAPHAGVDLQDNTEQRHVGFLYSNATIHSAFLTRPPLTRSGSRAVVLSLAAFLVMRLA